MGKKKVHGTPSKIESSKDLNKYVGSRINEKIDKIGGKVGSGGKQVIDKAEKALIQKGADPKVVSYLSKVGKKGFQDLIRKGVGGAKNWVHTEGREAVRKAGEGIRTGAKRARDWISDKWERITRRR
jgi:hypothetical protein